MEGSSKGAAFEPYVVVMFCQHAAAEAGEVSEAIRSKEGCKVRLVVLPCSSKIEIAHLIKLLEQGADGIEVVGCPPSACRFQSGSPKADGRVNYLKQRLAELELGADRLGMTFGTGFKLDDLYGIARKRAEAVRGLGPNPMREVKASA